MNWLEIAVIIVLLVAAIIGYIRGFVKSIFAIVSLIVVIGLSWVVNPYVSDWVGQHTSLETKINSWCIEQVENKVEQQLAQSEDQVLEEGEQQAIVVDPSIMAGLTETEIIDRVKGDYPSIIEDKMKEGLLNQAESSGTMERVGTSLGAVIYKGIIFILTMILITVVLKILETLLDLVAKLPVLKTMNKMGGLLFGILRGLLWVWTFGIVLSIVVSTDLGQRLIVMVQDSVFLTYLYGHNGIQWLIGMLL